MENKAAVSRNGQSPVPSSENARRFYFVEACRVSPRRARYFLLRRQKKVPKEKATLQSALRVPVTLPVNAGSETNSLRSNMFRFFFRIDRQCYGASPRVEHQHQSQHQHHVSGLARGAMLIPHFSISMQISLPSDPLAAQLDQVRLHDLCDPAHEELHSLGKVATVGIQQ